MRRVRLHAEQHDDAGAVARDRHRHRRRDRRAREHIPVRRGEGRRRRRKRRSRRTEEIGLAVMATTLSLVVIFVPVAFMTGQIGRYFFSFGITSAAAILLSMFVSFTLTPALCAWWLRPEDAAAGSRHDEGRGFYAWSTQVRRACSSGRLRHRPMMLGIAGAVVVSAVFLYPVRRQGTGARRRPERVQRQPAAAARHQLRADARVHDADRRRAARRAGDNSRR